MSTTNIEFDSKKAQRFFKKLTKNVDRIGDRHKEYIDTISVFVIQDIERHFETESGSENKRWPEWSDAYTKHMIKIGKGSNFKLQDSRHLHNSLKASNYRKVTNGIMWFNNAKTKTGEPYAAIHDQGLKNGDGVKMPRRRFMWLSKKALERINEATMEFAMRGLLR